MIEDDPRSSDPAVLALAEALGRLAARQDHNRLAHHERTGGAELLMLSAAAKHLGISAAALRERVKAGEVTYFTIGRGRRKRLGFDPIYLAPSVGSPKAPSPLAASQHCRRPRR